MTEKTEQIRVEYYIDTNPESPSAYERYITGTQQTDFSKYRTVVLDSFSGALRSAKWAEQFLHNSSARGTAKLQWYGESADRLERIVAGHLKSLPCNVIVIAHVGSKQDNVRGSLHWGIDGYGRLSTSLPRDFGEVYYLDVVEDQDGRKRYVCQTEKDDKFFAKTHLGIRNNFTVDYGGAFGNLLGNCTKINLLTEDSFSIPLHILLYGDSGAGKSLFAASFPKPMLVLHWDGYDNAIPYLEQGKEVSALKDYGDGEGPDTTKYHLVY